MRKSTHKRRERSSSLSYRGPAKPIPVQLYADNLSARWDMIELIVFAAGLTVVGFDMFVWRF